MARETAPGAAGEVQSAEDRLVERGVRQDNGVDAAHFPQPIAPPAVAVLPGVQAEVGRQAAVAAAVEGGRREAERVFVASPWKLMWWKFLRHRIAVVALAVTALLYLIAFAAEFIAPYGPNDVTARLTYAPPTAPHFFDAEGHFHAQPFVYGLKQTVEPIALRRVFTIDTTLRHPLVLFPQGKPYNLAGLIPWDRHLFGV